MSPTQQEASRRKTQKSVLVSSIVIAIAMLHFLTGSHYKGPYPEFVNGYLLDILVPFAFYLLLCLQATEISIFKSWPVKSILIFGACSGVEIAQFYGVPIFGRTFDPSDFIMYGIGVLLAALVDTTLFPRTFDFWTPETSRSN